jgi:hypothetical protein
MNDKQHDKYNIGLLMVNIDWIWLDAKGWKDSLIKLLFLSVSQSCHINIIFTINRAVVYLWQHFYCVVFQRLSQQNFVFCFLTCDDSAKRDTFYYLYHEEEKIEDTKRVIRNCKSEKNSQIQWQTETGQWPTKHYP